MLTFVTWLWTQTGFRTRYTFETVIEIKRMIAKYYKKPHRFICVTDQEIPGIETIDLGSRFSELENPTWKNGPSCYRRLIAFSKDAKKYFGSRFVSIDLDTIIMDDITELFDRNEEIVLLSGKSREVPYCGTLWMMNSGCRESVWTRFDPETSPRLTMAAGLHGSDQAWLGYSLKKNEATWKLGGDIQAFLEYMEHKTTEKPKCKIMFFNGKKKPWDLSMRIKYPWIKDYYGYEQREKYRICTVQFSRGSGNDYAELLRVFRESVRRNMPTVAMDEILLGQRERDYHHNWTYESNSLKLRAWVDYLNKTDDDVILADCDMLAVGDARPAFDLDFDVAYTGKSPDGKTAPMNGGIIFVRPNSRSRAFFKRWLEVNELLYKNPALHEKYRRDWLGMNQAAFGYMMANGYPDCKLIRLPQKIWNATDSYWSALDERTVFVHIKGQLRTAVLKKLKPQGILAKAMKLWYSYSGFDYSGIPEPKIKMHTTRIPIQ
jgi:hypothetical protein